MHARVHIRTHDAGTGRVGGLLCAVLGHSEDVPHSEDSASGAGAHKALGTAPLPRGGPPCGGGRCASLPRRRGRSMLSRAFRPRAPGALVRPRRRRPPSSSSPSSAVAATRWRRRRPSLSHRPGVLRPARAHRTSVPHPAGIPRPPRPRAPTQRRRRAPRRGGRRRGAWGARRRFARRRRGPRLCCSPSSCAAASCGGGGEARGGGGAAPPPLIPPTRSCGSRWRGSRSPRC